MMIINKIILNQIFDENSNKIQNIIEEKIILLPYYRNIILSVLPIFHPSLQWKFIKISFVQATKSCISLSDILSLYIGCQVMYCLMKRQLNRIYQENQESSPIHKQSNITNDFTSQEDPENFVDHLKGIKLAHLELVTRKNRQRQQIEPSFRETHEIYELLQKKMVNKDVQKIVKSLYNNLIVKRRRKPQKFKEPMGWEDLIEAKDIQIPEISSKQYSIRPIIREKKYLREGDEERFLQRQIIAKAFVDRQYGLQHLQAQINESNSQVVIKRQRYTDLAYAVVTEGYRSLEHFLINQCKRSIKPSDKFEMGALHKILCNCRILLKPQDTITFLKFVRLAYNLQSLSVTQQAAVRLYITLQKEIRSRIGNRQLDRSSIKRKWTKYLNMKRRSEFSREQFTAFVTPSIQKEVVKEYIRTKLISKVKNYLNEKYSECKHLFTLQSVRGIVCKIVRIAIKRVYYYHEKFKHQDLPQLLPIDSAYRCKISKGPESMNIRMQLLKLWFTKEKKILKRLPLVINKINEFIYSQENQKGNYTISKVKPTTTVIEKLDFNINVSRTKLTQGYKLFTKESIVLKGMESNFEHYINKQNGKKLHYYRKIGHNGIQQAETFDKIKRQDLDGSFSSSSQEEDDQKNYQVKEENVYENDDSKKIGSFKDKDGSQAELAIKEWLLSLDLDFFKNL